MTKFIALYMAPISALDQLGKATPEQLKAGMDEWNKWGKQHEKSILDMGTPLGKTKRVTSTGTTDTRNELTGYSIVEGDSLDSVSKMFANHPHFKMIPGASIEVVECLSVTGM